jgi:hypothetical protein
MIFPQESDLYRQTQSALENQTALLRSVVRYLNSSTAWYRTAEGLHFRLCPILIQSNKLSLTCSLLTAILRIPVHFENLYLGVVLNRRKDKTGNFPTDIKLKKWSPTIYTDARLHNVIRK